MPTKFKRPSRIHEVTIPDIKLSLKKNPLVVNYLYQFMLATEALNKRTQRREHERFNTFIGALKFEAKQAIEKVLLKPIIFADEVGHMRLIGHRIGVWDSDFTKLAQKRHEGALQSPFLSSEYEIKPVNIKKDNKRYVVRIFSDILGEKATKFYFEKQE
jgi:hypothetical protein